MRKNLLPGLLLSFWSLSPLQAQEAKVLDIVTTDGRTATFILNNDSPTLSFEDGTVCVSGTEKGKADASILWFNRSEVVRINIVAANTAIDPLQADGQKVRFHLVTPDEVRVSGLNENDKIVVSTLGGKIVKTAASQQGGEAVISLGGQPRGCYIVNVNKHFSFKLMKP